MPFAIRPAVPEDAPVLHAMNIAFNGDTGVTEDDVRRSLQARSELVLIAECDGEPVGFCCAQVHRSFCYPAPVAEVTEMYVSPAHRGQGCAGAMLIRLEHLLQEVYGVDEMHLLTGTGNLAAQAAYRKAGFEAVSEQYMSKSLYQPAETR